MQTPLRSTPGSLRPHCCSPTHAAPNHSLVVAKKRNDQSCPSLKLIKTVTSLRAVLNLAKTTEAQEAVRAAQSTVNSGSWGPIYGTAASSTNNSGAVGTAYNILQAGAASWKCCLVTVLSFRVHAAAVLAVRTCISAALTFHCLLMYL